MDWKERRGERRIEMMGTAFVFGAAGKEEVQLRDLSRRGIGIAIDRPVCNGEALRVVLSLDGKTWTDLHGVVRHAERLDDGYVAGIEFEGTDPAALAQVETYVRRMHARVTVAKRASSASSGSFRMVRDNTGKLKVLDPGGETNEP